MRLGFKIHSDIEYFIYSISIGDKSVALDIADRKRTQYPVDYSKNKRLKARFIIEKISLSESSTESSLHDDDDDEPPPHVSSSCQISLDERSNNNISPAMVHADVQTTPKRLFSLFRYNNSTNIEFWQITFFLHCSYFCILILKYLCTQNESSSTTSTARSPTYEIWNQERTNKQSIHYSGEVE